MHRSFARELHGAGAAGFPAGSLRMTVWIYFTNLWDGTLALCRKFFVGKLFDTLNDFVFGHVCGIENHSIVGGG